jgi:predicted nucleic acid-binding protein
LAVVDASVVIKWFANEENSKDALLLKEAYEKGLEDLSAPCILPFEVLNGLKYTLRLERISVSVNYQFPLLLHFYRMRLTDHYKA